MVNQVDAQLVIEQLLLMNRQLTFDLAVARAQLAAQETLLNELASQPEVRKDAVAPRSKG